MATCEWCVRPIATDADFDAGRKEGLCYASSIYEMNRMECKALALDRIARLTAENAKLREACAAVPRILYGLGLEDPRQAAVAQKAIDGCRRALADADTGEGPQYATDADVAILLAETKKRFAKSLDALANLPPRADDEKEGR